MKLDQDREIIEVARHTEQVTFQPSTRRTRSGFHLPMLVHERLAFSPEEYIRRYDVIQDAMARMDLDALLVRRSGEHHLCDRLRDPGYYKYHCVVIPRNGEPIFLVRDFEWRTRRNSPGRGGSLKSTTGIIRPRSPPTS